MAANATTPFSPLQFSGWASFYGGNVQAPQAPPPSAFGAGQLGQPPTNGQYTGGWAYPDAWANFYEGIQGFTSPQNQNSPAGALAVTNYARNVNNPNDPNLLGWEQAYGNPNTIIANDDNWAKSLGKAPVGAQSNELTGGWQNPAAWASFYGGTHGFTAPENAGSPASALAAASQIAKTSNPQNNPALLGWVQDFGQPGSVLANTPNWAASLGTPNVNKMGQDVGQTNTQGWDSPIAWAAFYGGFQGFNGGPVDNDLQAAKNWAGVTDVNDPSLLGWELDYGNPQTVVSFLEAQNQAATPAQTGGGTTFQQALQLYQQQLAAYNAQQAQIASQRSTIASLTQQEIDLQAHITQLQRTDPTGANYYINQLQGIQAQLGQTQTQLNALSASPLTYPAPLGSQQTAPGFVGTTPAPSTAPYGSAIEGAPKASTGGPRAPLLEAKPIRTPEGLTGISRNVNGANYTFLQDGSIYVNGQLYQKPVTGGITGPLAAILPPPEIEVNPGIGSPTNTAYGASFGHGATGANAGQIAGPAFGPSGNFENVIQAFGSAGAPFALQALAASILGGMNSQVAALNSTAEGGGELGNFVPAGVYDLDGNWVPNPFPSNHPFGPQSVFSGTPLTSIGRELFNQAVIYQNEQVALQQTFAHFGVTQEQFSNALQGQTDLVLRGAQEGLVPGAYAPGGGTFAPISPFFSSEPTFASLNYTSPSVFDDFTRSDLGGMAPLAPPTMPDYGSFANLGTGWTPPALTPAELQPFSFPDFGGLGAPAAPVDDFGRPIFDQPAQPFSTPDYGGFVPQMWTPPTQQEQPGSFFGNLVQGLGNLLTPFSPGETSGINPDVTVDQVARGNSFDSGFVTPSMPTGFNEGFGPEPSVPMMPGPNGTQIPIPPTPFFQTFDPTQTGMFINPAALSGPEFVPAAAAPPSDVFTDPLIQGGPYGGAPGMVTTSMAEGEEPGVYPADQARTDAEKIIQKFGGKATLYQLAQAKGGDAAAKMQENRSMLGEGAWTYVLDLSKPLEPQIEKAIPSAFGGERGTVAGKVIEAMQKSAPSAAVQQHLMQFAGQAQQDVREDIQQDKEEGAGAYTPWQPSQQQYNIVPYSEGYQPPSAQQGQGPQQSAYTPNISPFAFQPGSEIPHPAVETPGAPPTPSSFAQGSPFAGAPPEAQELSYSSPLEGIGTPIEYTPGAAGIHMAAGRTPEGAHMELSTLSPDLTDIISRATSDFEAQFPGYKVEAFSGRRHSTPGSPQGPHATATGALDMQIVDPEGNVISSRGSDPTGLYRQLAQIALGEQRSHYPQLGGQFNWGGAFETSGGSGTPDLMHFDLSGVRGRYTQNLVTNLSPMDIWDVSGFSQQQGSEAGWLPPLPQPRPQGSAQNLTSGGWGGFDLGQGYGGGDITGASFNPMTSDEIPLNVLSDLSAMSTPQPQSSYDMFSVPPATPGVWSDTDEAGLQATNQKIQDTAFNQFSHAAFVQQLVEDAKLAFDYFNPPTPTFDQVANIQPQQLQPQQLEPTIPSLPGGTGGFAPEAFGGTYNVPSDVFAAQALPDANYGVTGRLQAAYAPILNLIQNNPVVAQNIITMANQEIGNTTTNYSPIFQMIANQIAGKGLSSAQEIENFLNSGVWGTHLNAIGAGNQALNLPSAQLGMASQQLYNVLSGGLNFGVSGGVPTGNYSVTGNWPAVAPGGTAAGLGGGVVTQNLPVVGSRTGEFLGNDLGLGGILSGWRNQVLRGNYVPGSPL